MLTWAQLMAELKYVGSNSSLDSCLLELKTWSNSSTLSLTACQIHLSVGSFLLLVLFRQGFRLFQWASKILIDQQCSYWTTSKTGWSLKRMERSRVPCFFSILSCCLMNFLNMISRKTALLFTFSEKLKHFKPKLDLQHIW
jgi:hypothetical protein